MRNTTSLNKRNLKGKKKAKIIESQQIQTAMMQISAPSVLVEASNPSQRYCSLCCSSFCYFIMISVVYYFF